MKRVAGWVELARSVGRAALELLRSELAAVEADLQTTARNLAVALGLLLGAVFVLFWALGALAYVCLEVLSLWLPRWASGLILLAVLIVITLVLVALGRRKLRRLETPADTVRRRLADHRQWWEQEVEGQALPTSAADDSVRGRLEDHP